MKMRQQPDQDDHADHANTEGECDRCHTTIQRFRGQGDLTCPTCGANYNCSGQRLRDDLHTRVNPSEYDEDISDLEGYETMWRRRRVMLTYAEACEAHAEAQGLTGAFKGLVNVFKDGPLPYTIQLDQTGGFVMLINVHETGIPFPHVWISYDREDEQAPFCCGLYLSEDEDSTEPYVFSSEAALPEVCLHLLVTAGRTEP